MTQSEDPTLWIEAIDRESKPGFRQLSMFFTDWRHYETKGERYVSY